MNQKTFQLFLISLILLLILNFFNCRSKEKISANSDVEEKKALEEGWIKPETRKAFEEFVKAPFGYYLALKPITIFKTPSSFNPNYKKAGIPRNVDEWKIPDKLQELMKVKKYMVFRSIYHFTPRTFPDLGNFYCYPDCWDSFGKVNGKSRMGVSCRRICLAESDYSSIVLVFGMAEQIDDQLTYHENIKAGFIKRFKHLDKIDPKKAKFLLQGFLKIGLTPEEVMIGYGPPFQRKTEVEEKKKIETWIYWWMSPKAKMAKRTMFSFIYLKLFFQNKKLTHWKEGPASIDPVSKTIVFH